MDGPLSPHNGVRRAPRPCSAQLRPLALAGFTLLELLTVIAILGILVSIAFTAASGAQERSRRTQCRAEIAVLAQALEAYRVRFGDYPQTGPAEGGPSDPARTEDGPGILFNALTGRRGPGTVLVPVEARSFVSLGAFTLQTSALPSPSTTAQSANAVLDPWGRRYLYYYKTGPAWVSRAPLLLSVGADGAVALPSDLAAWDGVLTSAEVNADNLIGIAP